MEISGIDFLPISRLASFRIVTGREHLPDRGNDTLWREIEMRIQSGRRRRFTESIQAYDSAALAGVAPPAARRAGFDGDDRQMRWQNGMPPLRILRV
ncbi:MAG: hypothetical protein KGL96_13710, partial [Hyphomicrobiales bacterium]|nr:hypothetical protein [Hyphomicrobiales bacterium]